MLGGPVPLLAALGATANASRRRSCAVGVVVWVRLDEEEAQGVVTPKLVDLRSGRQVYDNNGEEVKVDVRGFA